MKNPFAPASGPTTTLQSIVTRFRAYQLGEPGASYSYFAGGNFTLIEARRTAKLSHQSLMHELQICGKKSIDTLHITSWDRDHCNPPDLDWILQNLSPKKVEYPGYVPHSPTAEESLSIISKYRKAASEKKIELSTICVNPEYITGLESASQLGYRDMFYHPKVLYEGESNNNSTVKLFRTGCFNVASLGDIEHANIGSYLRRCKIFSSEVDVLVLPHHGARSDVMTKKFLEEVRPTISICNSNFDNQYDHPCQEIKELLYSQGVKSFTTKTGDVLIESIHGHSSYYRVINLQSDSTKISSVYDFRSKKSVILTQNADSIRNHYRSAPNRGPR